MSHSPELVVQITSLPADADYVPMYVVSLSGTDEALREAHNWLKEHGFNPHGRRARYAGRTGYAVSSISILLNNLQDAVEIKLRWG